VKALIFGSTGFIGTHLSHHFENQLGWQVVRSDQVVASQEPNYFCVDLRDLSVSLDRLAQEAPFDLCINCSGAADVALSLRDPNLDFALNVSNFYRILNFLLRYSPRTRLIQLSSAAVYGQPECLPISETHPLTPLSPYGWHKKRSETLAQEFHQAYGLSVCSLRIFSAYGPGLKKQIFWDLAKQARANIQIKLYGSGEESRDFIFIDDLINAIELIFQKASFTGEVINVANGKEITIKDAATTFLATYKWAGQLEFGGEERAGDPRNWRADITLLEGFGYRPRFGFEHGIERYVRWLQDSV
jgi:dTDP-glucose 4,6-dehydratase/UDP-glucose 4-epimerase